jgi:hypothetical protein
MRIWNMLAGITVAAAVLLAGAVAEAQKGNPAGWLKGDKTGWITEGVRRETPPGFDLDRGLKKGWGTTEGVRNALPKGLQKRQPVPAPTPTPIP